MLGLSFVQGLGWEIYIGLLFVAMSFVALGAVMGGNPDFEDGFGGVSMILGLVVFFATMTGFDSALFLIGALLTVATLLLLLGLKVYSLSRGLAERGDVTERPEAWRRQPGAIRVLTVSLFLVGSFYIAFTVYVFFLEVVWAGAFPQRTWGYWYVGFPSLILTVFGITYITMALAPPQRTAGAWQQALIASGMASGISVLLSAWWLGFLGWSWAIPLAFAVPSLALHALAPTVPASLIGARRHFGIGVEEAPA